jgi:hypothetical protein
MNRLHQLEPSTNYRLPTRRLPNTGYDTYRTFRRSPHRMHLSARAPRAAPAGEVNERYRQHPATGSFTVETEGEITQWDKLAAHRSASCGTCAAGACGIRATAGACAKESRDQVAAPPRCPWDTVMAGHIGDGTTAGSHTGTRRTGPRGRRARLQGTAAPHPTGATTPGPYEPYRARLALTLRQRTPSRHRRPMRRTCTVGHPVTVTVAFHEGTRGTERSCRVPTGGRP